MTDETKEFAEETLETFLNQLFIVRYGKISKTSVRYAKVFIKDKSFFWYKRKFNMFIKTMLGPDADSNTAIEDTINSISACYRYLVHICHSMTPEENRIFGRPTVCKQLTTLLEKGHL